MAGNKGLNDLLVHFILEQFEAAEIQNMGKVPFAGVRHWPVEPLLNGTCNTLVITPPEALYGQQMGFSFVADFAAYGLNYALDGLAARCDYVEKSEDTIRKIVKALWRGCTITEPTVTSPSELSRNTAGSKIIPLPGRPMI